MNLLEVKNLKKYFQVKSGFIFEKKLGTVRAVDGISFYIKGGQTLGLVGESGCGKTTAGRLILRLIEPTSGDIFFKGQDVLKYSSKQMRAVRGRLQVIFQDPYASLNPRMTVGQIISEPLLIHGWNKKARQEKVEELLEKVGLEASYKRRFPHQFSGGQRQRIGIARALALNPDLIICDEPVSALDVSVQAQIINLLCDLQEELNLSYLFISHDLSVVRHISHRVAVMYLGRIVEVAPSDKLYENPLHPYTQALLKAVPIPDPVKEAKRSSRFILKGEPISQTETASGCPFHARCYKSKQICRDFFPPSQVIGNDQEVFCHFAKKN